MANPQVILSGFADEATRVHHKTAVEQFAAERVDRTISKLPGFADARLLCGWLEKKGYSAHA